MAAPLFIAPMERRPRPSFVEFMCFLKRLREKTSLTSVVCLRGSRQRSKLFLNFLELCELHSVILVRERDIASLIEACSINFH